jgi:hypothetical protein
MRLPVALAAAASLASLAVPNAAHALIWNWSFLVDNGSSAIGTFATASTAPVANQDEVITGATGTYARVGSGGSEDGTCTIAGIYNLGIAKFRWDGTPGSAINNNTNFEIQLMTSAKNVNFGHRSGISWGAVDYIYTPFSGNDGSITSATLSSVLPALPAPGPLPLIGAGAAFGWSRRLPRRVKSDLLKATPLSTTTAIHFELPPLG